VIVLIAFAVLAGLVCAALLGCLAVGRGVVWLRRRLRRPADIPPTRDKPASALVGPLRHH
jgi:uncharacterized iron-regulated membrane protein